MTQQKPPHQPMFNFSEKFPAYLAGIFILVQLLVMAPIFGAIVGPFGILRPIGSAGTNVVTHAISLLGHGFVHGGWTHVLMNSGMTIVFGIVTIRGAKLLAASRGKASNANMAFLLIFLTGVAVGGLFQWGFWAATNELSSAAVGASGGASALFAATGWAIGGRDKMLQFGFGWAVINLVMVLAEPVLGFNLAWPAHIGGYIGGMLLAPIFIRPNCTTLRIN